nr:hypothetical protein [uncultured Cetobacterium sp.]
MKKYLIFFSLILVLVGCTNAKEVKISDIFISQNGAYSGGFENAGGEIFSEVVERDDKVFYIEKISDTATTVTKVYMLEKDFIRLIFIGETENVDLSSLKLNKDEVVLKKPFKKNEKWESQGNKYTIIDSYPEDKKLVLIVEKIYPSGMVEIIKYKENIGVLEKKSFITKI